MCMEQTHKPNVRERVLKYGIHHASDVELLMLILGAGSCGRPVEVLASRALEVLETCSGQNLVLELLGITGLGQGKALALAAVLELGRRKTGGLRSAIRSPSDLFPHIERYASRAQEHFLCIALNGARELLHVQVVAVGSLNRAIISPCDVFVEALRRNASAVILCHNHPSGDCSPSQDDIDTTMHLLKAAQVLGLSVLDHVIVSRDAYFSFMNNDLLPAMLRAILEE